MMKLIIPLLLAGVLSACTAQELNMPIDGPLTEEQIANLWERAVRTDTQEEDGSWTGEWYADGKQLAFGNMIEDAYYTEYYGKIVIP